MAGLNYLAGFDAARTFCCNTDAGRREVTMKDDNVISIPIKKPQSHPIVVARTLSGDLLATLDDSGGVVIHDKNSTVSWANLAAQVMDIYMDLEHEIAGLRFDNEELRIRVGMLQDKIEMYREFP